MRTVISILVLLFCGHQAIAQLSKTSLPVSKSIYTIKGDYYRQYKNYVLAVNTYNKAVQQNPKEVPAMLGMADAYHMLGKDDLAAQWYKKALATNPDVDAEYILKYITILSKSNNAELRRWIINYNNLVAKSGERMDSTIFVTENLTSLNSKNSDSAPLVLDSKIIFSSDRAATGNFKTYESALNSEGNFEGVSLLNAATNSGRVEGGFSIAHSSNTFFFTGTEKGSTTTPPAMEIFYSTIPTDPSTQLKINRLSFKNFDHSLGQPTVSSDGTMLYFAAHSPKHTRGFDLYHSQFNGKKWSPPVALGTTINSHGDELYPMLVNDSTLYFASNGHGGLGGFDIFKVNLKQAHHHPPQHLPAPINSAADEFSFVMNSSSSEYYLSSNRPGGLGSNDIYRVYKLPFRKKKHDGSKPEELFIYTSKGDEIKLSGGSKENLKFDFQPGQKYNLTVEYDNFKTGTTRTTKSATSFTRLNFYTFDIQRSSEAVYDKHSKMKPVQDIHINPGDLVTFQLTPNMVQDPDAEVSKIQFQKMEAVMQDGQTIVFSYVAEGDPGLPQEDALPTDLAKLDTTSTPQPVVAKSATEKTSAVTPTSSVPAVTATTPAPQNITATTPTEGNKSVNPEAVAGQAIQTKASTDKSPQVTPTSSESVVATTLPELQTTTNAIDSNKSNSLTTPVQSTPVKAVVPVAIAGSVVETQKEKSKPEQVQNNTAVSTPVKANETVVTAKTEQKNSLPKNIVDSTSTDPSIITKQPVTAKATETQKVNTVAATGETTTPALPNQKNTTQTPVVSTSVPTSDAADIQYRVQIAASKSPLSDDQLKRIYSGHNQIRSFSEEGYQKYYIEQTPSFPIAKRVLNESGVPQAFIAAYQGDKKLNLPDAIAFQKKDKTSSAITESEIKNPPPEQHLASVNTQPFKSVAPVEKPSITTESNKENVATVTPTLQNVPASDKTKQATAGENKIPTTSVETSAPVLNPTQTGKEVQQEKNAPIATEASKENQAVDVAQTSPSNAPSSSGVTTQKDPGESKPVINKATDKVSNINAQANDSTVVPSEKITANSTEAKNEKEVVVVTPTVQNSSGKIATPVTKTRNNTETKKPSHDIAARDDFSYRLQIAASETPLNEVQLKKIYQGDKEVHSFKEDGKHKYYLLETSNYFVARQTLNDVKVNQAFISAYKKDVKVPLEQAINDQYKLPEIRKELSAMDSVIKVTTVNFEFDKFELLNDQLERLRNNAISELVKNPSYHVIVNGYTDIRGSETYNFGLSQERALFVARQIVDEGIDAKRVATHYFGESQLAKYCPEHENCDESIHQANRRVEILLLVNKKGK